MKRRIFLSSLAGVPVMSTAQVAVAARKIGVVSTVGDRLLIVHYLPHIGSALDTNRHEVVPLPSTELNDAALIAVKQSLGAASNVQTVFYRAPSPDVFDGRTDDVVAFPPALKAAFEQDQLTQVLLLTKRKGAARFEFERGNGKVYEGTGTLNGLGFYLDFNMRTRDGDTNEAGYGFLGPFVYMDLLLVDVASGRVLRREAVEDSRTLSSSRNATGTDPWGALSSQEKVNLLRQMLADAIHRVVPPMLAG
jgi:hypothetical protein